MVGGNAPGDAHVDFSVFTVPAGTDASTLFLGIIFGLLSFAGFEAAATLGEEARDPRRDIPRAILGTAIFGGVYFTVVTAVEMMAFGRTTRASRPSSASPALMGDLGTSYVGAWVGDLVTLGAAVSAFACCLACIVGASRLLFALAATWPPGTCSPAPAPTTPRRRGGRHRRAGGGDRADLRGVLRRRPFDTFLWSGTIGTLILLVAYVLATVGCIKLVFVDRKLDVPRWQVVVPVLALVVLGYTLCRNVMPYPTEGAARWFPVVAFGWLLVATVIAVAFPGLARRLSRSLASADAD